MSDMPWTWRLSAFCCAALLVTACGRGDIERLDGERFSVTARGYHGEAADRALDRARAYCEQRNKQVLGEDVETVELDPGFYRATLTFRCVEEGHPDLPTVGG
jgi:hypothetical protein